MYGTVPGLCADDRMQDGVGRQPDRRQYRSERCVSDGDKYGWQLLYADVMAEMMNAVLWDS